MRMVPTHIIATLPEVNLRQVASCALFASKYNSKLNSTTLVSLESNTITTPTHIKTKCRIAHCIPQFLMVVPMVVFYSYAFTQRARPGCGDIVHSRQQVLKRPRSLTPLEPPNPSLYYVQVILSPKTGFQL